VSILSRILGGRQGEAPEPRCVVIDTETAGLDPARDALLAIGAVAVDGGGMDVADTFEATVHNERQSDVDNVLVHGLGREAQRAGTPAAEALAAFHAYVAGAPCIGFHCEFDRAVLGRAASEAGVALARAQWLDLAELARALEPERYRRGARSLDDWLDVYGVATHARHSAAGDALATAELWLKLRAQAARRGDRGFDALSQLARARRWLGNG
jgi:DNA polymerase-3 subunit epsilon